MKKILILFVMLILPVNVLAIDGFEVVKQTTKYYKTTTLNSDNMLYSSKNNSITEEITREEYDSFKISNSINASTTVETTYKKMTTSLLTNGSYYRYKNELNWKNFPKVRSYDTIAIGHYASVKLLGTVNFEQIYCIDDVCRNLRSYTPQTFSSGSAATFKVPTGDLTYLKQTIYFDVQKNTDATIIEQKISGDYAHAVKTISQAKALKFTVSNIGITYSNSDIKNSYDEIQESQVTWKGSW